MDILGWLSSIGSFFNFLPESQFWSGVPPSFMWPVGSQSVVPRAAVSVSPNNMLELQILSPHPDLLNQKLWFWSEWLDQKWFASTLCFQISPPSDSEAGLSVTTISLRRSHSLGDDWVRNGHTTWFWSIIFEERTAIQLLGKVCSFLKERHIETWSLYFS